MPTARSGRRCRSGAGPTWSGPGACCSPSPTCIKFVLKEPIIPAGANKGVFLLAPLVTAVLALAAWAVIPVNAGWVDRRHQCRRPLHLRDLLARRLRRDHGRLGVELEISVPRRAALGGADGVLRSLDRLRHHHRAALRRLAQPHGHRARRRDGRCGMLSWYLAAAAADVRRLLRLGAGGDQPAAVRSGGGGIRARRRLHGRISARRPTCCSCSANTSPSPPCARMATILFLGGWLPPFPFPPFTWVPGVVWFVLKVLFHVLHVRHGEGLRAALSLRPADAARLEGVPAGVAGHGRDRRRRAADTAGWGRG